MKVLFRRAVSALTAVLILLCVLAGCAADSRLCVVYEKCDFVSLDVFGDRVALTYMIYVSNTADTAERFTLSAELPDEAEAGLLKTAHVTSDAVFSIGGNTSETYTVVFYGDYGGTLNKAGVSIPERVHIAKE